MTSGKYCFCMMLVLAVLVGGCFNREKDPQYLYDKALEHLEKSEMKEAIFELRRAIQIDGKFADARYQLGLLYLEGNEPQKAFDQLLRTVELDPTNLDATLKVAQFYLVGGNRVECRKYLEQVLDQNAVNRQAIVLLANVELIEENFALANQTLSRLGGEVENSDELSNIRGRIYAAQKEWEPAEGAFHRAISLGPDTIANYTSLLRLYEIRQEKEKSKALLDEMIRRFPDNVQAHLLLAGYHRAVGESDKSDELLQEVIQLEPDNFRHRLQLANFYRAGGKQQQAESVLAEARLQFDKTPEILAALAGLYFDQGRLDETRQLLSEMDQNYGEGILLRVKLLQREGDFHTSMELLKKLVTDYPAWAEPFFYLGLAHYKIGEINQAKFAVGEALQKKKGVDKYHALMAEIHLHQNAFAEAEKEAVAALRLNQNALPVALLLSRTLIGSKQYSKAETILTDINRQISANPEILGLLAEAAFGAGNTQKGESIVDDALELDPGNIQVMALALRTRYGEDPAGAEEFVRGQLAKAPENHRVHLLLGGLLEKREKPFEALAAYERAAELKGDDVRSVFAAARLYKKLGQTEEAMENFQTMVARHPNSLPGHMGIAILLEAQGDKAGAMQQYERILSLKKDFAPAANNLAWLIASDPQGDLGKALMLAMEARRAMPEDPNVADTLGYVHLRRAAYRLALTQFEIARQKLPDEPLFAFHQAQALYGDGQKDRARETLEKLLARQVPFTERDDAKMLLTQWREN